MSRKMRTRGFLAVVVALVCMLALGQTVLAQTRITVWSFGSFTGWLEEIARAFERENPGIRVQVEGYPHGQMHDSLLISLQTGVGAPDLATIEIGRVAMFYKGDQIKLLDLTSYLQATGDLHQIFPSRLAPFSYQGAVYGVPFDLTPAIFFYRDDIYRRQGLDGSDIPTWDDFIQAGRKLKAAGHFALQLGNGVPGAPFGHF